ncbi:MAG: hypothetical protein WBI91_01510 [Coriobacteriia bacterium]
MGGGTERLTQRGAGRFLRTGALWASAGVLLLVAAGLLVIMPPSGRYADAVVKLGDIRWQFYYLRLLAIPPSAALLLLVSIAVRVSGWRTVYLALAAAGVTALILVLAIVLGSDVVTELALEWSVSLSLFLLSPLVAVVVFAARVNHPTLPRTLGAAALAQAAGIVLFVVGALLTSAPYN